MTEACYGQLSPEVRLMALGLLDFTPLERDILDTQAQTRIRAAKGPFSTQHIGREALRQYIGPLAAHLAASKPPRGLEWALREASRGEPWNEPERALAFIALRSLLDRIHAGWKGVEWEEEDLPDLDAQRLDANMAQAYAAKKAAYDALPADERKDSDPPTLKLADLQDMLWVEGLKDHKPRNWEMVFRLKLGRAVRDELEFAGLLPRGAGRRHVLAKGRPSKKKNITPKQANRAKHIALRKFRVLDWQDKECALVGDWLWNALAQMSCFDTDEHGFPKIADDHKAALDVLAEELVFTHPLYMPLLTEPPPWTDWRTDYDGHISATFVRTNDPETEAEIKAAFEDGTIEPHARAVSAVQRVPLKINAAMIPLLRRFAGDEYKRDVIVAEALVGKTFWNRVRCDFRGRLIQLCDFNYTRSDPVRSLFLFAEDKKLGDSIDWLKIAVANAYGKKGTWAERREWVDREHELIKAVANDPSRIWQRDLKENGKPKAKEPFQFAAACMEYVAASQCGPDYVTHLPVWLDASSNGLQHLALMLRDVELAHKVNLEPLEQGVATQTSHPYDSYEPQIRDVYDEVKPDAPIDLVPSDDLRDLLKKPIMTLSYGVTPRGMLRQIGEKCVDLEIYIPYEAAATLRDEIWKAIERTLPGAMRARKFIQDIARHCLDRGMVMQWKTSTGFPVSNRYRESKVYRVRLPFLGQSVSIARDYTDKPRRTKTVNGAVANLVHSMDASHLCRSINRATEEGITNFMTVHDCYGALAPDVGEFARIRRHEIARMYQGYDPLPRLEAHGANHLRVPDRDPRFSLAAVANYSTYFDR